MRSSWCVTISAKRAATLLYYTAPKRSSSPQRLRRPALEARHRSPRARPGAGPRWQPRLTRRAGARTVAFPSQSVRAGPAARNHAAGATLGAGPGDPRARALRARRAAPPARAARRAPPPAFAPRPQRDRPPRERKGPEHARRQRRPALRPDATGAGSRQSATRALPAGGGRHHAAARRPAGASRRAWPGRASSASGACGPGFAKLKAAAWGRPRNAAPRCRFAPQGCAPTSALHGRAEEQQCRPALHRERVAAFARPDAHDRETPPVRITST